MYKVKAAAWFSSNVHLLKTVIDVLDISTLTKAKYELWLRDEKFTLGEMGYPTRRQHAKSKAATARQLSSQE